MKPELKFETLRVKMSCLGESSSVPDMAGSRILQNDLTFYLDENDEIFEAYGKRTNSYPYRQYTVYDRKLEERQIETAVLENDYIKAVFLPSLGGRLWSLTDKKAGKNLLYTNDVIRFSNLAIRNAWFSGGVEWNLGIIGHTPFTTEQMHTASLEDEKGNPVLRMYEYERVRGVEYQMDFWLGERDEYLNCRMRIVNSGSEVVPMYWWSNMAVPELEKGRIIVPAEEAYTSADGNVYKVSIPVVDGVDISAYKNIPDQVDYFFNIPEESPKYIAHLDQDGYGLLQISTGRMRGRKVFSWGKNRGSDRWQEFLTEDAGRYLEIQAGLGKTQYGCIPMPPHSAWEWMEQYGPVRVNGDMQKKSFAELREHMTGIVANELKERQTEQKLRQTAAMAKSQGTCIYQGSSYGALEKYLRELEGERPLSEHLDYGMCRDSAQMWKNFLETGSFPQRNTSERPDDFMCDRIFLDKLKIAVQGDEEGNWYAHYHLGLLYAYYEDIEMAVREFRQSLSLEESPWAWHGLASVLLITGDMEGSGDAMKSGIALRGHDLSYVKEGLRILLTAKRYETVVDIYGGLPEEIQRDSRILFDYITALSYVGREEQAYHLLMEDETFILDDLRECEDSLGELYVRLYSRIYGRNPEEIPYLWDFNSLG